MNTKDTIIPFEGYGDFKLYQTIRQSREIIKKNRLPFKTEVWSNKDLTSPVPWIILRVDAKVNLFFAKDKLFKIHIENDCPASLPNGIRLGTSMDRALEIDPKLKWDDWEEDFQSPDGYWLEDELERHTVMSITIFIKEALDEEEFERYEW